MEISVSGRHMKVGESLSEHARVRLSHSVTKAFPRAVSAEVVFTKEGGSFRTDIHVQEGTGSQVMLKSQSIATDAYACFDLALTKLERQLRRYKNRLTDHHRKNHPKDSYNAVKYVLAHSDEQEDNFEAQEDEGPVVISERQMQVERLSVNEAIMRMDLAGLPALLFLNDETNRINVVYHRTDGNISWVDPAQKNT